MADGAEATALYGRSKARAKISSLKKKRGREGSPPWSRRQGLCGSGQLAGVLGLGPGGQGLLESRGAGPLPETSARSGSADRVLCLEGPLTTHRADVRACPRRAFWGGLCFAWCVPASCQAARQLPGLGAQGWRQSAGLRRPSHGPSGPCHVPQRCAPSVCGPAQPRESGHLGACSSRPPAQWA